MIKKLEWKKTTPRFWEAKIKNMDFGVFKTKKGFGVRDSPFAANLYPTLQEAQATAQHHFEEYVRGFCEPDPLGSEIEALIRQNFELKGLLEKAEEKIEELKTWM